MPCYITGSAEGDAALEAETANKEATKLTELLCRLCQFCEEMGNFLPPDIKEWWEKHKEVDRERLHKEWLEKLSDKERRIAICIETCLQDLMTDNDGEIYDYVETNLPEIIRELRGGW